MPSKDIVQISDNIYLSGQINKDNKEKPKGIFFIKENDTFIKDPINVDKVIALLISYDYGNPIRELGEFWKNKKEI